MSTQLIDTFRANIKKWQSFWLENSVYGILSREIYKMSSRSRLTRYPKSLSTLNYERRRKMLEVSNEIQFSQFWAGNAIYMNHNLFEHFQFSEYDNLLGAKLDDILGSFTRASFSPLLEIDDDDPVKILGIEIQKNLQSFFDNDIENRNAIIQCFDNQASSGYGAIKLNYKVFSSRETSVGTIPKYKLFFENCPYPELCFFNPFSTSHTKTDSYYDDPLSFCGQLIKVSKNTIKAKYGSKFKHKEPLSLGLENQQNMPLWNYVTDRRSELIMCAEYYDYVDGKCRYTLFCGNAILEQYMMEIDFLPMIFVAGNTAHVNNIQQVYSIFDKFLPIQKAVNHINQMLLENSFACKASTVFFTNTATSDNLYKTLIDNFSKYNVVMLPMTTKGAEEQIPPMNIPPVELPASLLELRTQYLLYLEQAIKGNFDHDDSGFGQSGRALQLKMQAKSNLYAKQLGNLTLALEKFCDFYKRMYFLINRANSVSFEGLDSELIRAFQDYDQYRSMTNRFFFRMIIDPDRSVTKEVNQTWIANAMPLVQSNPVLAEEMFYLLLDESELPNKAEIKASIQMKMELEKQKQAEMAQQPTPVEKLQAAEIEADKDTQLRKIEADMHKQSMKDSTALLNTILKGQIDTGIEQTKLNAKKLEKKATNG